MLKTPSKMVVKMENEKNKEQLPAKSFSKGIQTFSIINKISITQYYILLTISKSNFSSLKLLIANFSVTIKPSSYHF